MRDYLSKEFAHIEPQGNMSGAIEIIEKVYQAFYWKRKGLMMWFIKAEINSVKTT